jgi:glycosyltransferase involved in cell wall biosynthesis
MPDVPVTVVAPGVPRRVPRPRDAPAAFVAQAPRHVIAVVGAVGPHKGSMLLRSVAAGIAGHDAALVVIGYTDGQLLQGWVERGLFVHGPYADDDLPAWLAAYRTSLALFPNRIPESFSYTLSETWRAGMPVLVPPIGALAERVRETQAGWVMSDDEWSDDDRMLDRILALLSCDADEARDLAAGNARAVRHATPEAMTRATLARYASAIARAPMLHAPGFGNARIRDALGYRPWQPPALAPAAADEATSPTPDGVLQRIAQRALAMRRTPMGRLLYRVTPEPLIDALKARLHG